MLLGQKSMTPIPHPLFCVGVGQGLGSSMKQECYNSDRLGNTTVALSLSSILLVSTIRHVLFYQHYFAFYVVVLNVAVFFMS